MMAVCLLVGQSLWQPALALGPHEQLIQSSLSDVFVRNLRKTDERNADLIKQACVAKENGHYRDAIALYLAAASGPLCHQKFAIAKPTLETAFSLVPDLSVDDRRQAVLVVARMLKDLDSSSGMPDASDKEYLCHKGLEITKQTKGSTPADRADFTVRLAFFYCYWKRDQVREAEAMLVQLLGELENSSPGDLNINRSLEALTWCYDVDEQVPYSKECWERRIRFVRAYEPRTYADVLEKYVLFLLDHQMYKAASPVADELLVVAWRPDQSIGPEQRLWEKFGNEFALVDKAESNKFFKVAFELYTHDPELTSSYGYGSTAAQWSRSLEAQGKRSEAIAVLRQALEFSQHFKDGSALRQRQDLVTDCAGYLRADNLMSEADQLEAQFHKEEEEFAAKKAMDDQKQLASVMSDPKASPQAQVQELTKNAYLALDSHNCDDGLFLLNLAVSLYEKNSSADADGRMYDCFQDVRSRLSACGQFDKGTEMVWRLIGARMKTGLDDPEFPRCINCHQRHLWPAQELFPMLHGNTGGPALDRDIEKLLSLAKDSGIPANVIVALFHQKRQLLFAYPEQSRVAICEEIERLRSKANSRQKYFAAMFEIAEEYVRQNKFAQANEKWRSALKVQFTGSDPCGFPTSPLPWYLNRLGAAFFEMNRLADAGQVFLESYRYAFEPEGRDRNHWVFEKIRMLAWKYSELHDLLSAEILLKSALARAQSTGADGSEAVGDINFTLAQIYVVNKLPAKAADAFDQFLLAAKVDRGELEHKTMIAEMRQYGQILKDNGYSAESGAVFAQADTAEKTEVEKLKAAQANRPKPASEPMVLSKLDRLIK